MRTPREDEDIMCRVRLRKCACVCARVRRMNLANKSSAGRIFMRTEVPPEGYLRARQRRARDLARGIFTLTSPTSETDGPLAEIPRRRRRKRVDPVSTTRICYVTRSLSLSPSLFRFFFVRPPSIVPRASRRLRPS